MSSDASTVGGSTTTANDSTATTVAGATVTSLRTFSSSAEREKDIINATYKEDATAFQELGSATWIDGINCQSIYQAIAGNGEDSGASQKFLERVSYTYLLLKFDFKNVTLT